MMPTKLQKARAIAEGSDEPIAGGLIAGTLINSGIALAAAWGCPRNAFEMALREQVAKTYANTGTRRR